VADGHGGRRKGAGRPRGSKGAKSQKTVIREKALAEANGDAEYALGLFVTTAKDAEVPLGTRLICGREVMDRVWGRPTQHKTLDAVVNVIKGYEGVNPDDWDDDGDSDEA